MSTTMFGIKNNTFIFIFLLSVFTYLSDLVLPLRKSLPNVRARIPTVKQSGGDNLSHGCN